MINIEGKRKPTDEQFDYLIRMIEEGIPANPSIDEVFDSFRLALQADVCIRGEEAAARMQRNAADVKNPV